MIVQRFLDLSEQPVSYGSNDCCTVPADCVRVFYGRDVISAWRGRYSSERGFMRIIRKDGFKDFREAFSATMKDCGLVRVDEPKDFALGLISISENNKGHFAPAFYYGGFWHCRWHDGPIITNKAFEIWHQ